ncbi:MAG: sce7726 family protein [bacterium]
MLKANDIKIKLIQWLLENESDFTLGNEVLFSSKLRRADLVMIKNNKTYAFEIKSDRDNTRNLESQLEDYLSTFDYTILVVTKKTEKHIKQYLSTNVGLYIIDDNGFQVIRKPIKTTKYNKMNLLEFLDKNSLIKLIAQKGLSKFSVFELRILALKKASIKTIRHLAIERLFERYSRLFNLFKIDIDDEVISKDDLLSLTGNIKTNKLY